MKRIHFVGLCQLYILCVYAQVSTLLPRVYDPPVGYFGFAGTGLMSCATQGDGIPPSYINPYCNSDFLWPYDVMCGRTDTREFAIPTERICRNPHEDACPGSLITSRVQRDAGQYFACQLPPGSRVHILPSSQTDTDPASATNLVRDKSGYYTMIRIRIEELGGTPAAGQCQRGNIVYISMIRFGTLPGFIGCPGWDATQFDQVRDCPVCEDPVGTHCSWQWFDRVRGIVRTPLGCCGFAPPDPRTCYCSPGLASPKEGCSRRCMTVKKQSPAPGILQCADDGTCEPSSSWMLPNGDSERRPGCTCKVGYFGQWCDQTCLAGPTCNNHGMCTTRATGITPTCLCHFPFVGSDCLTRIDTCLNGDAQVCYDRGICKLT